MLGLKERPRARKSNPYVGPRPFRNGDELHGRDREAREVQGMLVAQRVMLLHSPSGAGKTSLLQASVMPALRERRFTVHGTLRVSAEPPADQPVDNRYVWSVVVGLAGAEVAAADSRYASMSISEALAELAQKPGAEPSKGQVLVFDQFEEVLTLNPADRAGQAEFFEQVGEALEQLDRWALFSIREDYMGGLARYEMTIPTYLQARYRLDFLEGSAARRAVQRPALKHGVTFTDEAATRLVDDLRAINVQKPGQLEPEQVLGPYVEPVHLQVVCNRMWRRLSKKLGNGFTEIEPKHIEDYGDFDRALSDYYADAIADVAQEMKVEERAMRDWIDDKLITHQAYRSQSNTGPDVGDGNVDEVLAKLERRYLIRSEDRGGTRWHELTHDRLVRPIRINNRDWRLVNLHRWDAAADEWRRSERRPAYLLLGSDVWEAHRWLKEQGESADATTREFIEASRAAQRGALATRYAQYVVALFWIAVIEAIVIVILLVR